jgi:hypothetical protein
MAVDAITIAAFAIFAISLGVHGAMPAKVLAAYLTGNRITPIIPVVGLPSHCIDYFPLSRAPNGLALVNNMTNMVSAGTVDCTYFEIGRPYLFLKE